MTPLSSAMKKKHKTTFWGETVAKKGVVLPPPGLLVRAGDSPLTSHTLGPERAPGLVLSLVGMAKPPRETKHKKSFWGETVAKIELVFTPSHNTHPFLSGGSQRMSSCWLC